MPFPKPGQRNQPWPTSMNELDPSERLVVWSFRRWVLGLKQNTAAHWDFVWNEFARQLGSQDGREALSGFACMVKALQCNARRRIHYHQPCCPGLGADEVSIVCFVAACQNGQLGLARALAQWLVKPDGSDEMITAATRLAEGMQSHGLVFPERCGAPAMPHTTEFVPQAAAALH